MVVRVGGMYGRKRTLGYPKSYDSGSKAAGTAAPSVGRKSPRQGAKHFHTASPKGEAV